MQDSFSETRRHIQIVEYQGWYVFNHWSNNDSTKSITLNSNVQECSRMFAMRDFISEIIIHRSTLLVNVQLSLASFRSTYRVSFALEYIYRVSFIFRWFLLEIIQEIFNAPLLTSCLSVILIRCLSETRKGVQDSINRQTANSTPSIRYSNARIQHSQTGQPWRVDEGAWSTRFHGIYRAVLEVSELRY